MKQQTRRTGSKTDIKGKREVPRAKETPRSKETPHYENEQDSLILIGRNAVLEAINHQKPIDKIFIKRGEIEGTLKVVIAKAKEQGIVISEADKGKLDELSGGTNHQGVVAMCPAHEYVEVSEILDRAEKLGEEPFILILDGIVDPHNLGAIIRTADASGVHGIIIPKRRAAGLTSIVSKTSSGALEHVMISRVTNLVREIEILKERGIWIACGDLDGDALYSAPLDGPIALVIGGEDTGVGRLIKSECDFCVKIPMYGKISSLNASVAAGILMYEVTRRRHFKLR